MAGRIVEPVSPQSNTTELSPRKENLQMRFTLVSQFIISPLLGVAAAVLPALAWSQAAPRPDSPSPAGAAAAVQGEPWLVTTLYEFYGAKEREPSKRERKQSVVCARNGSIDVVSAANAELPADYKDQCWVSDRRAEPARQQIKYACKDGTTAEAATRREQDGSFGSQIVMNVPDKGAISITRTMRKVAGVCDPDKAVLNIPAPPKTPSAEPPRSPPAPTGR